MSKIKSIIVLSDDRMADVHSREIRSYNMSQIRGKNTKPEILVRKFLFAQGLRFRLHSKKLAGKPDIILPKYKTVILIHGCFWHGHKGCKFFVIPKSNASFWRKKIRSNQERDKKNHKSLSMEKWRVITIFECQLKTDKKTKTLNALLSKFH